MESQIALPGRPATYAELRALGLTDRQVRRMVSAGELRKLVRGVFAPADLEDSVDLRAAAVRLVVADNHVIVDRTAAWLHRVDVFTFAEHEVLPPVETCSLRGRHPTERGDVRGGSRDLAPKDIMVIGGLRVTTPLRTALDLGCNLRRRDAYAALTEFARIHGITPNVLGPELARYKRRRGVVQLRHLIPLVDTRVESAREAWTLLEILDAGLPLPEPQVWVGVDGRPTFRLDFAWVKSRVCLEYDGADAHLRTEDQRRYDARRRQWLRDNGWTVIVIREGDFTGAALDLWLGELERALAPAYTNRRW